MSTTRPTTTTDKNRKQTDNASRTGSSRGKILLQPGDHCCFKKRLRDVPEVKEAYFVSGVYDIVAKVEKDSMDRLKEVIARKARRLDSVRSTRTTVVMEGE
jgi:DNA-binding Lrp family transcriptional regulator